MDKEIKLKGRYTTHLLKQLTPVKGGESKTYKLVLAPDFDTVRVGTDNESGYITLDCPGGPMLTRGSMVGEYKIKYIDHSPEIQAFIITFE